MLQLSRLVVYIFGSYTHKQEGKKKLLYKVCSRMLIGLLSGSVEDRSFTANLVDLINNECSTLLPLDWPKMHMWINAQLNIHFHIMSSYIMTHVCCSMSRTVYCALWGVEVAIWHVINVRSRSKLHPVLEDGEKRRGNMPMQLVSSVWKHSGETADQMSMS